MITNDRLIEIEQALEAAGEDWPAVAKTLPEFARLHRGIPAGPGLVRPWVLLKGPQEWIGTLIPVRLVQFGDGAWLLKGQRQGVRG